MSQQPQSPITIAQEYINGGRTIPTIQDMPERSALAEQANVSKDFENELRMETKPMHNDTNHQLKKLHPGLKFRAEFYTNRAFWWEQNMIKGKYMKAFLPELDSVTNKPKLDSRAIVYVPHEIMEGDSMYGRGYKFCFEIFIIDDRITRRRIEKLLKTKFIWEVYNYQPPTSENI